MYDGVRTLLDCGILRKPAGYIFDDRGLIFSTTAAVTRSCTSGKWEWLPSLSKLRYGGLGTRIKCQRTWSMPHDRSSLSYDSIIVTLTYTDS